MYKGSLYTSSTTRHVYPFYLSAFACSATSLPWRSCANHVIAIAMICIQRRLDKVMHVHKLSNCGVGQRKLSNCN